MKAMCYKDTSLRLLARKIHVCPQIYYTYRFQEKCLSQKNDVWDYNCFVSCHAKIGPGKKVDSWANFSHSKTGPLLPE